MTPGAWSKDPGVSLEIVVQEILSGISDVQVGGSQRGGRVAAESFALHVPAADRAAANAFIARSRDRLGARAIDS
jgi:hypothetical protein